MQHVERLEFTLSEIEKFINDNGIVCPHCSSEDGQKRVLHSVSQEGLTVHIYCCCLSCNKKWAAICDLTICNAYPLPYQEEF